MNNKSISVRNMVLISGLILVTMFGLSLWAWGQIPEGTRIPVHWNARGEVDRYGGVFEGLFLLPIISTAVVVLLAFIPRIEPRRLNLAESFKPYAITWIAVLLLMAAIHVTAILSALGQPINTFRYIPAAVGLLFIVMGNYLGKVQSNYMFGIRTPWTLDSELSWNKTHRLGGKLFVLLGLLMIVSTLVAATEIWVYLLLGGILGLVAVLFIYSYLVWRQDPNVQAG